MRAIDRSLDGVYDRVTPASIPTEETPIAGGHRGFWGGRSIAGERSPPYSRQRQALARGSHQKAPRRAV